MTTISMHIAPTTGGAPEQRRPRARRFFGVAVRRRTYANLAFLLTGLPLGTVWFSVLVTGYAVSISMVVVALLGIPMLLGMWYVTRLFGNVERAVTNALLNERLPGAPIASASRGNVWQRLRSASGECSRWRELGYLVLRFPAGIATFTLAAVGLSTPALVALAPVFQRTSDEPFGDWALSSRLEDIASSPWAWLLVPAGVVMLFPALHALNGVAKACSRWARAWL